MNKLVKGNNKGVTLIELLAVIVILGVIAAIAITLIGNTISNSKLKADQLTVNNLNTATRYYSFDNTSNTIFTSSLSDSEKIEALVESGFLSAQAIPQSKDATFIWDEDLLSWFLQIEDEVISLSPYGSTYDEITPEIISDIKEYYLENEHYGRTWGDYRYTDIGLDPLIWKEPILHIIYTPSGSKLYLEPEDGYGFTVYNSDGDEFYMEASFNWNIIYNDLDELWYFHSITPENEIDITTLVVEKS